MLRKLKFIIPAVILLASCKKGWLDINSDPNNPTEVEVSKLLVTAERGLGEALSTGPSDNGGLSELLSVYMHQLSTREEADAYGIDGNDFFLSTSWPKFYSTLNSNPPVVKTGITKNLEIIIANATADGNLRYAGIAKVLKAYTFSQLIDAFGDVPYSQANNPDILYPKFDDDAEIYPKLLKLLDSAILDLNNTSAPNILKPADDDIIYKGSMAKWTKAANTIKLKLYTQIRNFQDVTADVNKLISDGNLISSTDESFWIPFGPFVATDDRNPSFNDYIATQRSNHVSPWFYEILKGYNTNIFFNNPDPRVPYYIYNQLGKTEAPREGSQTEYRDSGFVSIYFGSVGPDKDRIQQNSISVFGIYPAGGRYDDGGAEEVSSTSGTGAAPYKLITYADRLFLEAELRKVGLVAGNPKTKLEEAVKESFKQVDYIVSNLVKPSQTVPPVYSLKYVPTSTATLNNPDSTSPMMRYIHYALLEYDNSPAKQLQIIMTEKWIAAFGSAVDSYSDYRRTGFPILFDPNNASFGNVVQAEAGKVQPPKNGDPMNPGAQKAVPVQLSVVYPRSLPWFFGELNTNQNAPKQKLVATYRVFWDK